MFFRSGGNIMNNVDLPDDSESSDEDYVPEGPKEMPSEEEEDGDQEDPLTDTEDGDGKGKKRKKKGQTRRKKVAKVEIPDEEDVDEKPKSELTEEDKKKHADSLWASFKMDTGFKAKKPTETSSVEKKVLVKVDESKKIVRPTHEKVKITQIFEFAGEEVKVEKEVSADSLEARLFNEKPSGSVLPKKGKNIFYNYIYNWFPFLYRWSGVIIIYHIYIKHD